MKTLFTIVFIAILNPTIAQTEVLKTTDLLSYSYPFEIINQQIIGPGADTLKAAINRSQFFMIGEEHDSPQISELMNIILPYFANSQYCHFGLEVGPFSATILKRELQKNNSLYPFNHEFYLKYKEIPIPFFDGKADELFLKTALKQKFNLWGLDQEFLSAPLFIVDEINSYSKNKTSKTYSFAKSFLEKKFDDYNRMNDNSYFNILDEENELTAYFKNCNSPKQKELIDYVRKSMNIYKASNNKSNEQRMNYMKRNFSNYYQLALKKEALPKVVIKMGGMHLGRGKSWLSIYDLGNMIYELASFNGTKATSVSCFSRYIEENENETIDYSNDEEGKKLSLILELATKDKWVLIDSNKIIDLAKRRKIILNADLDFLLSKYDYLLFSPKKTKTVPNY